MTQNKIAQVLFKSPTEKKNFSGQRAMLEPLSAYYPLHVWFRDFSSEKTQKIVPIMRVVR